MSTPSLDRVLACPSLPSLPGVAMEVLELTRDKDVPLRKIAEVVQNDQALAGKILKTVNSSFYGLVKPCPTISRAMAYLGIETVKSLVLGFSLVDLVGKETEGEFDFTAFWRRGIYGATGARLIAARSNAYDSEEAFVAALLQDIGMLAMRMTIADEYAAALRKAEGDHAAACASERELIGFDHQEAGAALAEKWRLPGQLVESIRHHHQSDQASGEGAILARLVELANGATQAIDDGRRNAALSTYVARSREWFDIGPDDAVEMLKSISENARELGRLFRLDTGPNADIATILVTANEILSEHQLEMQAHSRQLQQTNDDLLRKSTMDPLTGAANRATFDATLDEAFESAVGGGSPLGLLFLDLDRFKSINDTRGHQAGDAVLVELVRRSERVLGDRGTLARYGGEEFAVVLPGHDLKSSSEIAEQIRAAVEAEPFALRREEDRGQSFTVTASIGVASLDATSTHVFTDTARLLHAADKAVYAAKNGGRNCVRVFAVRRSDAPSSAPPSSSTPSLSAPSSSTATAPAEVAPPAAATPAAGSAGRTVYLVEDDPMVVALVRFAIGSRGGNRLVVASSAEEALQLMESGTEPPDLVVCDFHLPGMSGSELVRAIRDRHEGGAVPVVVISADEAPGIGDQVQEAGADAFLPKRRLCDDPRQRVNDLLHRWCTTRRVA